MWTFFFTFSDESAGSAKIFWTVLIYLEKSSPRSIFSWIERSSSMNFSGSYISFLACSQPDGFFRRQSTASRIFSTISTWNDALMSWMTWMAPGVTLSRDSLTDYAPDVSSY